MATCPPTTPTRLKHRRIARRVGGEVGRHPSVQARHQSRYTRSTAESPPSDLHDLRKRCKELRYSLEIFGSLHDAVAQRALIDDLKKLQDCLGEFQDTEVQQHAIRTFASQMLAANSSDAATVEAVMAMGRLADRLGERQIVARGTFAVLFERFAGPQPRAHLAALYERAS